MDVQEEMRTVMETVCVTLTPENVSATRCGLGLTAGQQIVQATLLAQAKVVVMRTQSLVDVTVKETGRGKLVMYPVSTE